MEFRRTEEKDIDRVIDIIKQGQEYLKKEGIDQWQKGYPNRETIKDDIEKGYGYVLLKDGEIISTVAIIFDGEKTYDTIYEGKWLSNGEYCTIHRIAIKSNLKGMNLSSITIKSIEEICLNKNIRSIRVDTHRDNLSMQRFLLKNGFKYCGIIYLEDGDERLAYEKLI